MSSYELVPFDASHRDDYIRLLAEAWGARGLTTEEFEWWFGRNPEGSILRTALVDGQVAGVGAHMLARMVIGGEERRVSFSVSRGHVTGRDAGAGSSRSSSVRSTRRPRSRALEVVLGFGNEVTNPMFFDRLRWSDVAHYRIWARPVVRQGRDVAGALDAEGDAAMRWRNHVVRDGRYLRLALRRLAAAVRDRSLRQRLRGRLAVEAVRLADDRGALRPGRAAEGGARPAAPGGGRRGPG